MLKLGSRGDAVVSLQRKLVNLGYNVSVDGDFGPQTDSAVRAFQASQRLSVDGVVGLNTSRAIDNAVGYTLADAGSLGGSGAAPTGIANDDGAPSSGSSVLLRQGSKGAAVEELQQTLNRLGYTLAVDGDFGPRTDAAVKAFQSSRGLQVDGIVGANTSAALDSASISDPISAADAGTLGLTAEVQAQVDTVAQRNTYEAADAGSLGASSGPSQTRDVTPDYSAADAGTLDPNRDFDPSTGTPTQSLKERQLEGMLSDLRDAAARHDAGIWEGLILSGSNGNPTESMKMYWELEATIRHVEEVLATNSAARGEYDIEIALARAQVSLRHEGLFDAGLSPINTDIYDTADSLGTFALNPENRGYVERFAEEYGVDPRLLAGVMAAEHDLDHGLSDVLVDGAARNGVPVPASKNAGYGAASARGDAIAEAMEWRLENVKGFVVPDNIREPSYLATIEGSTEGAAIVLSYLSSYYFADTLTASDMATIWAGYRSGVANLNAPGDQGGFSSVAAWNEQIPRGAGNVPAEFLRGNNAHMSEPIFAFMIDNWVELVPDSILAPGPVRSSGAWSVSSDEAGSSGGGFVEPFAEVGDFSNITRAEAQAGAGGSGSGGGAPGWASSYQLVLTGDAGDNALHGSSGRDYIEGGEGRDDIYGMDGDDYIAAGPGNDFWVLGGGGSDLFEFKPGDGALQIGDWQDGQDKIALSGGLTVSDLDRSIDAWNGNTLVIYSTGAGDRVIFFDVDPNAIGTSDFIQTGAAAASQTRAEPAPASPVYDNYLSGDAGDNPLHGSSGRDYIEGGEGRDDIYGMDGDDYIAAGPGNDFWVLGGGGSDLFEFKPGDGALQIGDWQDGQDKIALSGGLTVSDLDRSIDAWNGNTLVIYSTGAGDRVIFFDVDPNAIDHNDFL